MTPIAIHKPFLLTTGEPAGIGPDIVLQLWQQQPDLFRDHTIHILADKNLLLDRAKQLGIDYQSDAFPVLHIPLETDCHAGTLNPRNAAYVIQMLTQATQHCLDGEYAGLITGPIHKGVLNDAGFSIAGHTDFLTRMTNTKRTVMMLMTSQLKVALFSDHVPLRNVPDLLTPHHLSQCLAILLHGLQTQFGLKKPRVLICGLNPHAGENGYLGTEEQSIMIPIIQQYQQAGHHVIGPIAADVAFTPHYRAQVDVILTMYHDQGLPVLKYAGFHQAINVTLGLPFIRTSVDHGTALDIAGTAQADTNSLCEAIRWFHHIRNNNKILSAL